MHLSGICLLQYENFKPPKLRNVVFESLTSFKNDEINILMLPIYQISKIVKGVRSAYVHICFA